jgi:predicted ribosome quality control (RQC) complex YloA/Tae2 family protein
MEEGASLLSLVELRRAVPLLEARFRGHRVQAIAQSAPTTVVFSTYGGGGAERSGRKQHLSFCCRPGAARVGTPARAPAALPTPPAFSQYLRAHVLNAEIVGFRLLGQDRQLAMRLRKSEGDFEVLLAIFGRRSNVLLLDARSRVVVAMRPLAETRPELSLGEAWTSPESRPPREGEDRFAAVADEDFLSAIEDAYAESERRDDLESLEHSLMRAFRKEAKSLDRKLEKIGRNLSEAEQAARLEREGELLKSVLSRVKRGDTEVVARDFASGEEVTISLDPKRSPSENLAQLFKRYQKAVRGLSKAGSQQEEVRAARAAIAALEEELETLTSGESGDAAVVEGLAARPEVRRLLAKHAPRPAPAASRPARGGSVKLGRHTVSGRLVPRRYRTSGGLEIWVGRSDEGNDLLSTRLARGNDLFFHLDGAPGSHVVLRTEGRADPPSEAMLDACELAVHFSKARNATRADVHVVPIKNVKKPKGAKPGLVMVHGGKTIHLRRMQKRLERVLAAQIEFETG